jgi:hypothetical protein
VLSFAGHNVVMKVSRVSQDPAIINFDVTDSSAIVDAFAIKTGDRLGVHLKYRSNPEVSYAYSFAEGALDALMKAITVESAGKFAQYVRENADTVVRINADRTLSVLQPRKEMVTA